MGSNELDSAKNEFLNYIQKVYISGCFPPQSWCVFGRPDDATNNSQESYNSMLNRLVRSFHPNPSVLLKHLVAEILVADIKVQRMAVEKKSKGTKTKI